MNDSLLFLVGLPPHLNQERSNELLSPVLLNVKNMVYICRQFELGRVKLLPEIINDGEGTPTSRTFMTYANFYAPNDILINAWNDIVACAIIAGKTVGIISIIINPVEALGIFECTFKSCLIARQGGHSERIHVSLGAQQL